MNLDDVLRAEVLREYKSNKSDAPSGEQCSTYIDIGNPCQDHVRTYARTRSPGHGSACNKDVRFC